jgi:Omp85 superfamily domain
VKRLGVGASAVVAAFATLAASATAAEPGAEVPPAAAATAAPDLTPPAAPSRWDWAFFPLIFYAPETSLGAAGGFTVFDDTPTPAGWPRRDDAITLFLQATLREQVSLSFSGIKYWESAHYQLTEDAAAVHFPNVFWGLGNQTPETASDDYTQDGAVSRTSFAVRVAEEIYVGGAVSAGWYRTNDSAAGGAIDSYAMTTPAKGSAVGAGPVFRRDTRDDAMGPHDGSFTAFAATFFPAVVGDTYRFALYELDQRNYYALGLRSVLALEAYGLYAPGHAPIAELPALGGPSRLRGYYQGRYRDHLYLMAQAEWRVPIVGRFGLAPFGAVGNVFSSPSAVSSEHTKVAGGLSLRFNLKKERDLYVHLDVAVSPESPGFYLNLGEPF